MWYANDDNSRFYYLASQYYWDGASLTYVDAAFADVQARGALYVAGYQYHLGDTDTYWLYETDEMTQVVGGVEMWNYVEVAGQDYAEFNSADADVDLIVNTTIANTMFIRGSDGVVAIGSAVPQTWKTATYEAVLSLGAKSAIAADNEDMALVTGAYYDITNSRWETTGSVTSTYVLLDEGITVYADGNDGSGAPGDALSWLELYNAKVTAAGAGQMHIGPAGTVKLAIGHAAPDVLCHIEQDIATTGAVQRIFRIAESCSGTVGDGFGVGMQFELESASQASMEIAGALDVLWEDEDTGDSDMVISLQDNWSLAEVARFTSAGLLVHSNDSLTWSANQKTAFGVIDGNYGVESPVLSATGGVSLRGYAKGAAAATIGVELRAHTENDPDDEGAVHVRTFKHDLAGALTSIGAAGHVFSVENNTTQLLTLHGNGALDLTHLAGTGVRNVVADANGQLSAQSGLMFSQTASVTHADSVTETTLTGAGVGSLTLPADFFVAGKTLMIEAWGFFGTKAPAAAYLDIAFTLGGADACVTGVTPDMGTTQSSQFWKVEIVVTCRSVGATGVVYARGGFRHNETAPAEEFHNHAMPNTGGTVDTTGTLAVDLTADWEVADVANTITCTNLIVNALN